MASAKTPNTARKAAVPARSRRRPRTAAAKPAGGERTSPTLGDQVLALANGKTQQEFAAACKGARPVSLDEWRGLGFDVPQGRRFVATPRRPSAPPDMRSGRSPAGLNPRYIERSRERSALVETHCQFGNFVLEEAMSDTPDHDLPDFDNPPVVETVLSAQFERLTAMRSVHFGLFWQRVRGEFPNTEDRPALASVSEQASEPVPQTVQLRFEPQEPLPLQRLWLINASGAEMMQIQNDRFIKNWRKKSEANAEYPHYTPVIKPAFERDFKEFQTFVADEKLGEIKVNQCEVTYVNHIIAGEGWIKRDEIEKIFTFCQQPFAEPYPGRAEDVAYRARFPIIGPNNEWIGRLHVELHPAVSLPDNKQMYAMNLTARGMYGTGIEFFDIGRRWIVKSFERLTTEHMHEIWRKKKR